MIKIGTIKVLGSALYQWELGRKVQIFLAPDMRVAAVQFAHMGDAEALNVEPREENGIIVADIPNILLQSGQKIAVFLVDVNENKVETTTHAVLPVIPRPRPTDYVYTETEVLSWQALEARVIAFMEEMNEAREAGDFNGDSAYEIAVKYGYKGTEEEWIAELQGNAAQSAARAEEAQNKAEEAQKKAEEAKGHAEDYANSAAQQAQSASKFVGTASAYASNAEQSAKKAATKANSAADYSRNALENAANAHTSYKLAEQAATNADASAKLAAKSEENAKAAQAKAEEARDEADKQRRMAAENSVLAGTFMDEALRYRNDALNFMVASDENRGAASTAASNAQSHQQGAETARSQASTYAKAAAASAEEAKQAAEEAKNATGGSGGGTVDIDYLSLLIEEDCLPAVYDADGRILTDNLGNVVLRY